ncbi:serine/threonine protein kinase [Terasakiella pusilla]|uniref:serine/threonine protein kinase n=1 Tax=Terasakiella pusilla TaxID=64973 RepID=UPI003AA8B4B4
MRKMPVAEYEKIGKFEVKRLVRSTGSSDLYECFDPDLETRVAIKVFNPKKRLLDALPYDLDNWRTRFMREVRILAQIDHPHVIAVRELSSIEGRPFYVMPFVETCLLYEIGTDPGVEGYAPELRTAPKATRIGVTRSVELMVQLASALSAFHGRGMVHRDIKPGNVLLTRLHSGLVKLCDPGLMKAPESEESMSGYWVGTREYLAPEQRRNAAEVDARADVFALGVLGYRMMTGDLPSGVLSGPQEEADGVPDELNDLIMRMMSRKLKRRPAHALDVLKELGPIRAKLNRNRGA